MVAPGNVNPTKVQAPPLPGQGRQPVRAAGVGMAASSASTDQSSGYQGNPRASSATQHGPEVLHQRSRLPMCPARMALVGFTAAAVIGYFTLYSTKKTEATALDVARVATGTATTDHTRPRN
ncbi:F8M12.18 protein [Striga asiatica]|uniref:F8M12.18 protein n=1 Tax=Striga asiatica TaxID=4170 RepID=A0A5A7P5C3_STRAF|nr:F8M12.18 protein [Striga asiatica]